MFCWHANAQLSMLVKELPVESFKSYIPNNRESLNHEIRYPGHVLEITLTNESNKSISLPLDSISYAIPYTENISEYYDRSENMPEKPDVYNLLGVFAFVNQKGKFKNLELGDPSYDVLQMQVIQKIEKQRLEKIRRWKEDKSISNQLSATYNWYLMNHMVTIPAHKNIKYKVYFNPALKLLNEYDDIQYYFGWDPKISSEVIFKLILPKNLYKFLTREDRRKYPDLFTGIVSSNRVVFKAAN